MARKISKKYEQLAFPELQLVHTRDAEPLVDELASGELPQKTPEGDLPALISVTPARKRASPRRTTIPAPLEATPGAEEVRLVARLAAEDSVEMGAAEPEMAEPVAAEQAETVESPVNQPDQNAAQIPAIAVSGSNRFPPTADRERLLGTTQVELREAVGKEQRPAASRPADAGERKLKVWTHMVTMASSLVVVAAVVFGSYQFYETQKLQRESITIHKDAFEPERNAKAVALFVKYNELMMQPTTGVSRTAKREAWYWKENLAVGLLESLFNLTSGRQEWEAMVGWALEKHGRFIREQRLSCEAYTDQFIDYVEKTFAVEPSALCRERNAAR